MVKDKHEEVKTAPNSVPSKALVEGHSPKAKPASAPETHGVYDHLLPADSVPGTEYFLTLNEDGTGGNLKAITDDIPVGRPVIRVFHSNQHGHDELLGKSGAPLPEHLQPHPDFRFKTPDPQAIEKSNEKYADNRRAHDHENAHREHAHAHK